MEVSFNLSARRIPQREMVSKLVRRLEEWDLPPSSLVIEVTESMAMTDPERTREVLHELHSAGVKVAIDDFGTGYSSLSRLKHLGADILKVDRSFVRDLPTDPVACSMVKAMVALAERLGMRALAEGIERKEQWDWLVSQGRQYGQGYYFSRPVPAEEITDNWRREGFVSPRLAYRGDFSVSSG